MFASPTSVTSMKPKRVCGSVSGRTTQVVTCQRCEALSCRAQPFLVQRESLVRHVSSYQERWGLLPPLFLPQKRPPSSEGPVKVERRLFSSCVHSKKSKSFFQTFLSEQQRSQTLVFTPSRSPYQLVLHDLSGCLWI